MQEAKIITKLSDAWKYYYTMDDWFYARKMPILIKVIEMREDFIVKTPEGIVEGKAGDFLLEGVEGEVYPCKKSIFEKTYTRLKKIK
jgi:hypothetical protein